MNKITSLTQLQKIAKSLNTYQKAYSIINNKAYGVNSDGTYYVGKWGDYGLCPSIKPKKNQLIIE